MRENSVTRALSEVPTDGKEEHPADSAPPEDGDGPSEEKLCGGHEEPPSAYPCAGACETPDAAAEEQSLAYTAQPMPEELPSAAASDSVKQGGLLARLVLKLCFGNRRLAEIARFAIVGVIATLADFIASGIVLYLFAPSLYVNFADIFNSEGASVAAQCVSTGVGFVVGVVVNYFLSVFFVFEERGNSQTALGFILFVVLSAGGLAINVAGMYLFVDFAGWNYWLIKILLTCVVLVYNYVTRKFIIFRKGKGE